MSRQIVNRILIVIFVVAIFGMGILYAKQEHKISELQKEQEELLKKEEKIKYIISEYNILIDNVNSRNYIIRIARDMFGWVFDDETIYRKPLEYQPEATPPNSDIIDQDNK